MMMKRQKKVMKRGASVDIVSFFSIRDQIKFKYGIIIHHKIQMQLHFNVIQNQMAKTHKRQHQILLTQQQ